MIIGQVAEKEAIVGAVKAGDANAMSKYFLPSIDLTIKSTEDVYSSDQAEMILKSFFSENSPTDFQLKHEGKSKLDDYYYIGTLKTTKGNFRCSFFLKRKDESFKLKQMRIEDMP